MEKKKIYFIGAMHFFLDSYMGYFAVYFVIAGLDPVKSALIITTATFSGNILQPVMGYFADRVRGKLPLYAGLMLTPVAMSLIGLTVSYPQLLALVFAANIGSSIFHPSGSNVAGGAGLTKPDRSFAIFTTIGTFGFALSQLIFSTFTGWLGTASSYLLMIPGVGIGLCYLIFSNIEIYGYKEHVSFKQFRSLLLKRLFPILLLFFIMVFRTAFLDSANAFLAKTFQEWGFSRTIFSSAHPVFTLSGAAGILAAGLFTHWLRPKKLLLISLTGFMPFFLLFLHFGGSLKLIPAFIFLALTGFVLYSGHGINVVMGHRIAPELTSTISGILMGFAWALASFGPTLCAYTRGAFARVGNLPSGLLVMSLFPLSASVLVMLLPEEVDRKKRPS